jgi:hypothetical protein
MKSQKDVARFLCQEEGMSRFFAIVEIFLSWFFSSATGALLMLRVKLPPSNSKERVCSHTTGSRRAVSDSQYHSECFRLDRNAMPNFFAACHLRFDCPASSSQLCLYSSLTAADAVLAAQMSTSPLRSLCVNMQRSLRRCSECLQRFSSAVDFVLPSCEGFQQLVPG